MATVGQHNWSYFRAGGVLQVDLKSREDLLRLRELDQKLWMALAMPVKGLNCDSRTLNLLDSDADGRIRPPEIFAAIDFLESSLLDPAVIFRSSSSLKLDEIRDGNLLSACRRALIQNGDESSREITVAKVEAAISQFNSEVYNGDSVIVPEATDRQDLQDLIREIIKSYASVPDRSGKPGIDLSAIQGYFAELDQLQQWFDEAAKNPGELQPKSLGNIPGAYEVWLAVMPKIDDFFARCRWAAFDPKSESTLNADRIEMSGLKACEEFPLAHVSADRNLPLKRELNPMWGDRIQAFHRAIVEPLFGTVSELTEAQWHSIKLVFQPIAAWFDKKPQGKLGHYSAQTVAAILQKDHKSALCDIVAYDQGLAAEYQGLNDCLRLLLYRRDLGRILRNFVNFADFYRRETAIFQRGSLFMDGRATALSIDVTRSDRHTQMAAMSGAYLVYCDCQRSGQPSQSIVCLMTNGDSNNLMVGRNGVFYDLDGVDWDATITKIVANPISLREAFFLPYKKMVRFIEEQVAKRAAAADAESTAGLAKSAESVAHLEKKEKVNEVASKKVDVGTVAAIGVAVGSISTFFGVLFTKFIDLGLLMPIGILALLLMISGPSMLLAWLKLKNRNLGPILDANGWAINTNARLNVPFAASMTTLRSVPVSAAALMPDPFAEKKRPWKLYAIALCLAIIAVSWGYGKLDRFVPERLAASKVLQRG